MALSDTLSKLAAGYICDSTHHFAENHLLSVQSAYASMCLAGCTLGCFMQSAEQHGYVLLFMQTSRDSCLFYSSCSCNASLCLSCY